VLPKLRAGDTEGGIVAGTNAIITQLSLDQATAQANVAKATQAAQPHGGFPFGAIFGLVIFFIVFSSIFRGHRGGGMGWLLPLMILNSGSRGGWVVVVAVASAGVAASPAAAARSAAAARRGVGEMLTPEDHRRIEAAVARAEDGTSGDIFCVLAGEVSSYREVPIAWGAAAALLIPPAVMAVRCVRCWRRSRGWLDRRPGQRDPGPDRLRPHRLCPRPAAAVRDRPLLASLTPSAAC